MNSLLIFLSLCFLTSTISSVTADEFHHVFPESPKPRESKSIEDRVYWNQVGLGELQNALNETPNTNRAKNVILFVGDGMSIPSTTAGRIYVGQLMNLTGEERLLSFELFPYVGLSKTYAVDFQVPDSAATATALLSGVKTNLGIIGVDARVTNGLCETMGQDALLDSVVTWFQAFGKKTGVVTTARITHATPAAAYSHTASRYFECNTALPIDASDICPTFKDIGRQLVEDEPGKSMNVILGGGLQCLDEFVVDTEDDPVSSACLRSDSKELWRNWLDDKTLEGKVASVLRTQTDLDQLDTENTDYVMGIFANSHLPYDHEIKEKGLNVPTLMQMTEKAIQILRKDDTGFFLLIEGGRIDHAHHAGRAKVALSEIAAFHDAVDVAMQMTSDTDTLIIVTADHSHTATIAGYPVRGNSITGLSGLDGSDGVPYTTLSYANGPGFTYGVENNTVIRNDLEGVDVDSFDYRQQAGVPLSTETHGGDDVAIYAKGPWAHLFHSVHEQNFIAHVMAYSACVGDYVTDPHCFA